MQAKGFLSALFDYSFTSFVTPRIIKILYVLATILISLWTLLLVVAAFNVSGGAGGVMLIVGGPLFFLLSMIYARVLLELIIVFFRINGNVTEIRDDLVGDAHPPAPVSETPRVDAPVIAPAVPVIASAATTPEIAQEPAVIAAAAEPTIEAEPAETSAAPEPVSPAPPASPRFCENCGAERSPGATFCTNCGHA